MLTLDARRPKGAEESRGPLKRAARGTDTILDRMIGPASRMRLCAVLLHSSQRNPRSCACAGPIILSSLGRPSFSLRFRRRERFRTSDPYRLCTGGLRKGLLGFFSLITTSSEVGGCRLGLVIADLSFSAPLSAGGVGWRGARTQVASSRATARLTLRVHRPAGGTQGPRRRWGFETRSETQFCQRGALDVKVVASGAPQGFRWLGWPTWSASLAVPLAGPEDQRGGR
jgi:hypothetical protein